jgi:hypothetical protein
MAVWSRRLPFNHILGLRRQAASRSTRPRVGRLEDRREQLARAVDEWLSLLKDMEAAGECGGERYDRYYQAYLQALKQQKDIDLQLFNIRRGLTD